MRHFVIFLLALALGCLQGTQAAPARPGTRMLTQPDGSTVSVCLRGDEHLHFYETTDGLLLRQGADRFYYYATESDGQVVPSRFVAKDVHLRNAEEAAFVRTLDGAALRALLRPQTDEPEAARRVAPGPIAPTFPTTGTVRGLVVLAQYQDIRFSSAVTAELYDQVVNERNYQGELATGSVRDYFQDQSDGRLDLEFDVVGPVTLSKNRAYYGSAVETGKERVDDMVSEAVKLAKAMQPDLDFSRYDQNGDKYVDFIFVIYAGYGESQGGPEECVWPQQNTLKFKDYTSYNGLRLSNYACTCELRGYVGEELDGIGTFCHEFSHILGLPDIYDPLYSGAPGLGYWDVMDVGSYNNNGRTPSGYTAMDKYTLGWLEPTVLESDQEVTLNAISTSNEACFVVSETNPNEYFTLENRQPLGWDAYLPGHGLMVCHVEYSSGVWASNKVNTSAKEYVHLVVADKGKGPYEENDGRDVFPGSSQVCTFNDDTTPSMRWNDGTASGCALTDIAETDNVVTFRFHAPASAIASAPGLEPALQVADGQLCVSNPDQTAIGVYTPAGRLVGSSQAAKASFELPQGIYLVRIGQTVSKAIVR